MAYPTLLKNDNGCPVGCQECLKACADRGSYPKLPQIEKVELPEENFSTVSTCNQCSDGDCLDVCPTGALRKNSAGFVAIDPATCLGCGLCNMVCPYGGIMSIENLHKSSKCDMCHGRETAACAEACPHQVLSEMKAGPLLESFQPDVCSPGLQFCAGCAMELVARVLLKTLGDDVVLFGAPSCCVLSDKVKVQYYGTLMTNLASTASGVSRYFKKTGRETICLALTGDGATADLAFGTVSAAAERGERILYVCYDNEAYMNTGIQRIGTTPFGAWTNTTQVGSHDRGKSRAAKDVAILIAEHGVNYAATATLGYMADMVEKFKKAKEAVKTGFAYIHVLAPCPTGWKMPTELAVAVTRMAVSVNYFPLWEAVKGNFAFTHEVKDPRPVGDYIGLMKRFGHYDLRQTETLQAIVDERYRRLKRLTHKLQ